MSQIYIGTVLLEKNRWGSRVPSFPVSEWQSRFQSDGFDGIELWENHALLGGEEEVERLKAGEASISVFNSYVSFDEDGAAKREAAARLIGDLRAQGVKYNFGNSAPELDTYLRNLYDWVDKLPDPCRILCECHPGTVMEDPAYAESVFRRLQDPRFQAIVHFPLSPEGLDEWFGRLGGRITHVHVQMRDANNAFVKLASDPERVHRSMEVLRKQRYAGSYTIEFTEGVRGHENIDKLYAAALDDLRFLRSVLSS